MKKLSDPHIYRLKVNRVYHGVPKTYWYYQVRVHRNGKQIYLGASRFLSKAKKLLEAAMVQKRKDERKIALDKRLAAKHRNPWEVHHAGSRRWRSGAIGSASDS